MMKQITEAKDVVIYKHLLRHFGDYATSNQMTGVSKLFQQVVDGGLKVMPKDSRALDILDATLHCATNPAASVQKFLNVRFSDLPIDVRPIVKNGRRKEVAFWCRNGNIYDKVCDLISFDAKGRSGYWCNVRGDSVELLDLGFEEVVA